MSLKLALMSFKAFIFCQLISCLLCFSAHSEILILQSSDQHSSYKKIPNFLASVEVLYREFKEKHPQGPVVLIINGDFSSLDSHSETQWDKGDFGYEILSQLAKKYSIIYTFGNHDAFDWNDSQLFLHQMTLLKQAGVNLVVANADFHPDYKNLFSPYIDLVLKKDQIIRFIGYTLPSRKRDALLKFQHKGPQVIDQINSINMAVPLANANEQKDIVAVVMSMHLGILKVKSAVSNLLPHLRDKLKLVFAGHDHKYKFDRVENTQIVDSNAYFNFSQVILDDKGNIVSTEFFNARSQAVLAGLVKPASLESHLIQQTREFLSLKQKRKKKFRSSAVSVTIPRKQYPSIIQQTQSLNRENKRPRCIKMFQGK